MTKMELLLQAVDDLHSDTSVPLTETLAQLRVAGAKIHNLLTEVFSQSEEDQEAITERFEELADEHL